MSSQVDLELSSRFVAGSASNLFALIAGGDVALSVLMTITTTLGAAPETRWKLSVWFSPGGVHPVGGRSLRWRLCAGGRLRHVTVTWS